MNWFLAHASRYHCIFGSVVYIDYICSGCPRRIIKLDFIRGVSSPRCQTRQGCLNWTLFKASSDIGSKTWRHVRQVWNIKRIRKVRPKETQDKVERRVCRAEGCVRYMSTQDIEACRGCRAQRDMRQAI